MNYRLLSEGEVIQEGDMWLDDTKHGTIIKKAVVIGREVFDNYNLPPHVRPITLSWLRKELKRLEEE